MRRRPIGRSLSLSWPGRTVPDMEPKLELSGALIDMSRAASRLVNVAVGQTPLPRSQAGQHLAAAADSPDWTKSTVRRADEALILADLAAIDHMRALAALLRSSISTSVALATVVRGVVEPFSRVQWLLTASSAGELVQRHVSLSLGDITSAKKLRARRTAQDRRQRLGDC